MEGDGVSEREKWYQGLMRGYWKRRNYEKLNRPSRSRRRRARVELGSNWKRGGRFWRIKISPNLGFFRTIPSPKKLLLRLRDAYIRMMLGLANSRVFSAAPVSDSIAGFGRRPVKEYDDKMILEIYKSMVAAQRQLVHRTAAGGPETETAVSRFASSSSLGCKVSPARQSSDATLFSSLLYNSSLERNSHRSSTFGRYLYQQ